MPHSILAMMDEAEFEDLLTIVAIEDGYVRLGDQ